MDSTTPRPSHPLLLDDYHETNRRYMEMTQEEYDAWWAALPPERRPAFLRDDQPVMAPQSRPAQMTKPRSRYRKGVIPVELRWTVWERDNFTCRRCGARRFLATDHIIPESKGGPTTLDNLQTLCKDCNTRKGNRA
jgi:hypothetical protein